MRPAASTATPRASAFPPVDPKSSTVRQSCAGTASLPMMVAATVRVSQQGRARILPLIVTSPLHIIQKLARRDGFEPANQGDTRFPVTLGNLSGFCEKA